MLTLVAAGSSRRKVRVPPTNGITPGFIPPRGPLIVNWPEEIKSTKISSKQLNAMSDSARQKPFPKAVLIFIALGVVGLGIVFAFLATIGDDVPNKLPPASQNSPGD